MQVLSHQRTQCRFNDVEACGCLKAEVKQSRADGGRSRSSDRALNLPLSQTCGEFSRGSRCALDGGVQLIEHTFIQKRIHPMTNSSKKKKFIQTHIHPKQFHPHAYSFKHSFIPTVSLLTPMPHGSGERSSGAEGLTSLQLSPSCV